MSKLVELGKNATKDSAVAGNTIFKFYSGKNDVVRINTDTVISLNHEQKEGETLDEFKLRVAESVYRRIEAIYHAYPHEIEAAGITIDSSSVDSPEYAKDFDKDYND